MYFKASLYTVDNNPTNSKAMHDASAKLNTEWASGLHCRLHFVLLGIIRAKEKVQKSVHFSLQISFLTSFDVRCLEMCDIYFGANCSRDLAKVWRDCWFVTLTR